jgi:hypothetical protein
METDMQTLTNKIDETLAIRYYGMDGTVMNVEVQADSPRIEEEALLMSLVPDSPKIPRNVFLDRQRSSESDFEDDSWLIICKADGFKYVGWNWVYAEAGGL